MSNGILYGIFAMFLYSVNLVVIERKLSHVPTPLLIAFYGLPLIVLAVIHSKASHVLHMPQPSTLAWILVPAILVYMADLFYFESLKDLNDATTIALLVTIMPAITMLIRLGISGIWPKSSHLIALFLASLSLYFSARG